MSDQPNEAVEQHVSNPIPISPATWLILVVAEFCLAAWGVDTKQGLAAASFLPWTGQSRRRGLDSYLSEEGSIQLAPTFNAGYIITETSSEPLSLHSLHEKTRGPLYRDDKGTRPRAVPGFRR